MIVVDASLATKLIIDEPDSDIADVWFESVSDALVAPDLLAVEVAQAIVRRVNDRRTSADVGRSAIRQWTDMLRDRGIELIRTGPDDIERAAALAIQLGHPVKDCVYLALAVERRCPLITCDRKFVERARPSYPGVGLLTEAIGPR